MNDLHGLAAAYALDALDAGERAEFEAHLATCPDCTDAIAGFADVVESLAESSSATPPAHLRAAVLSQLDTAPQDRPADAVDAIDNPSPPVVDMAERRRRRTRWIPGLLAAAAAVALIAVGAVVISGNRGGSDFDEVVSATDAVVTQLDGEGGTFEVAYSAELQRVALRGENVDALEPGLRYALWAIADGEPIPAGLYEPTDGSIDDVTEFADVSAQAWGITIEPESGSDTPTPPIIFIGEA